MLCVGETCLRREHETRLCERLEEWEAKAAVSCYNNFLPMRIITSGYTAPIAARLQSQTTRESINRQMCGLFMQTKINVEEGIASRTWTIIYSLINTKLLKSRLRSDLKHNFRARFEWFNATEDSAERRARKCKGSLRLDSAHVSFLESNSILMAH